MKLQVEIADTPEKREKGLMYRKSLEENAGMLFVFSYAANLSFWMKNTYIPLDIAFIDDEGEIFQIEEMPPLSTKVVRANSPCKYALEVNHGYFSSNNISEGHKIKLSKDVTKASCRRKVIVAQFEGNTEEDLNVPEEDIEEDLPPLIDDEVEENIDPQLTQENQEDENLDEIQEPEEQQTEPNFEEKVQHFRNMRDQIIDASNKQLEMYVEYTTKNGHYLGIRKVQPLDGEYLIKNGPNGEYLVAFDASPNVKDLGIKGMQPKSFLINNINKLETISLDQEV